MWWFTGDLWGVFRRTCCPGKHGAVVIRSIKGFMG